MTFDVFETSHVFMPHITQGLCMMQADMEFVTNFTWAGVWGQNLTHKNPCMFVLFEKSGTRETLNILICADNNTNKKKKQIKYVLCHMYRVTCHQP